MKGSQHVNFDRIAPIYDGLSKLVFGKAIESAQHSFLGNLAADANVLILGGGTGVFLPELVKKIPNGKIFFVDSSAMMIERAMARVTDCHHVSFIRGTLQDVPSEFRANVVVTHFFLDLFNDSQLADVVEEIGLHASHDAYWIVSDFVRTSSWWQRTLLKGMYFFFRMAAQLQNNTLPAWPAILVSKGWSEINRQQFYFKFIRAVFFQRTKQKGPEITV